MTKRRDDLMPLADGFTCRTSVAIWLIEASFRLTFQVAEGALLVSPTAAITAEDKAFILANKPDLIACVQYCEQQAKRPI